MRRDPSIHITESRLRSLMREFHDYDDNAEDYISEMVEYIMVKGSNYALEKRSLHITNQTMAKKVLNKVTNDKTDINLLSNIIYTIRKSFKHKGIKVIDNNSAEWSQLKKLVPIVNEYCNEFEIDKRAGYIDYVERGLRKISSYRGYLNKLYDMSEAIALEKDAVDKINSNEHKELTRQIHDYYISKIITISGISEPLKDNPIKYAKFVEVKDIVLKTKVDYKTYIDSQFEELAWTRNYPEPEQLISDKALERLNKHVYNKNNKIDTSTNKVLKNVQGLSALAKIKQNGKDRNKQ